MVIRVEKPTFNLRDKLNELDGIVPYEKMPSGSTWLLNHTTSATRTNVSSNSWTSLSGLQIDVTPRLVGSTLWVEHNFTMELHGGTNGIAFRVYRETPIPGGSVLVYFHDQHSHWSTGIADWSGPGTIYLTFMDRPNAPLGQVVRYYVQCKREQGNNFYSNYGQDESGIQNTVWEIKP